MNTIQNAVRNVISRETERLKKYDFSSEKMDEGMFYLIPGALCGVALAAMAVHAGGVTELPAYTAAHLTDWKNQVMTYAINNLDELIVGGSLVAAGGALMFLKGLRKEEDDLKSRWSFAFNPKGHGVEYIQAVEDATDSLLSVNKNIVRALAKEQQWVNTTLTDSKKTNLMILRTMGYDVADDHKLENLQDAYMFGVKKACADALESNQAVNGFKNPNYRVEGSIIEGMTEYFRATKVQEPGLGDKLKFVFFGDDELLKDRTMAYKEAHAGYRAIKKIRAIESVSDEFSL